MPGVNCTVVDGLERVPINHGIIDVDGDLIHFLLTLIDNEQLLLDFIDILFYVKK